jgi:hypothetical protein
VQDIIVADVNRLDLWERSVNNFPLRRNSEVSLGLYMKEIAYQLMESACWIANPKVVGSLLRMWVRQNSRAPLAHCPLTRPADRGILADRQSSDCSVSVARLAGMNSAPSWHTDLGEK